MLVVDWLPGEPLRLRTPHLLTSTTSLLLCHWPHLTNPLSMNPKPMPQTAPWPRAIVVSTLSVSTPRKTRGEVKGSIKWLLLASCLFSHAIILRLRSSRSQQQRAKAFNVTPSRQVKRSGDEHIEREEEQKLRMTTTRAV